MISTNNACIFYSTFISAYMHIVLFKLSLIGCDCLASPSTWANNSSRMREAQGPCVPIVRTHTDTHSCPKDPTQQFRCRTFTD